MALEFPVHEGLPADLNNFRTLVAQNRGYHISIPDGYGPARREVHNPVMQPYYTGLTTRVFVWIGKTDAWFQLNLYPGTFDLQMYYTSIRVEGTQVNVYDRVIGSQGVTLHPSRYTVTAPGYFTLALRLELPSHILAIFGENNEIIRTDHTRNRPADWNYAFASNGLIKLLSVHISDELGKGSSKVVLEPEPRHKIFNFGFRTGDFVVIEGRAVDTSQDIVLTFAQGPRTPVQARFPPTDLEQDEEVVFFVRNNTEGWLVESSFSPDSQFIRKPLIDERTYPLVSDNCEIHRMRWDQHVIY